jgi:hypothetical protein
VNLCVERQGRLRPSPDKRSKALNDLSRHQYLWEAACSCLRADDYLLHALKLHMSQFDNLSPLSRIHLVSKTLPKSGADIHACSQN